MEEGAHPGEKRCTLAGRVARARAVFGTGYTRTTDDRSDTRSDQVGWSMEYIAPQSRVLTGMSISGKRWRGEFHKDWPKLDAYERM